MVKALSAVDARCIVVMKSRVPLVRVSWPEMDGCFFFFSFFFPRKSRDIAAPRPVTCTRGISDIAIDRLHVKCRHSRSLDVHFARTNAVKSD